METIPLRARRPVGYLKTGTELLLFQVGMDILFLFPSRSRFVPPYHQRPHVQIPKVPTELVQA